MARPLNAARPAVRLLLIDRDHLLTDSLERASFRVTAVSNLDELSASEGPWAFDAVVLGSSGSSDERREHLGRLRERGYTGVIVAACRDATEGAALLEAGADDVATALAEPIELAMRVRAGMRRDPVRGRLRWGPLELDGTHRSLRVRGRSVALTARECALLACLIQAGDAVVSRESLREHVWKGQENRGTNLVEVHLSRLREKLGQDAPLIETVRGVGYRLRR